MNHHDSRTSLRLIQLQLDLAQEELKQLRFSRRSPLRILCSLLFAFSVLLVFPRTTAISLRQRYAIAISNSVSSGQVTNNDF